MTFSLAHVTATTPLSPRLLRVHFDVDDLDRLALPGTPDEAVGIYFPAPGETSATPMELRDDVWGYHEGDIPEGRNYSIRSVDPDARTMDVDFVVHARGPATLWAQQATAGQTVAMSHARGWYHPPDDTTWLLLVTDLAGLPATARIVENLSGTDHPPVTLIAEVLGHDDLDYLQAGDQPGVTIIPLVGSGNGHAASRLGAQVRSLVQPPGRGYCWFAAEAAESRTVRKYLRRESGWAPDQYDIIGYWRYDGEAWSRRYAEHGDELLAVYTNALAAGKTEKQAAEEFDDALERAGL